MLLRTFSWQELRHHPWRNAAAIIAVMLGVALAFSVQLINASALDEFSSAVRSVNGQPDLELRAVQGSFDEAVFAQVARQPQVMLASPVLELQGIALVGDRRVPLRVIGVDPLVLPTIAPALTPRVAEGGNRLASLTPGNVFLNAAARKALGDAATAVQLRVGTQTHTLHVAGQVAAGGAAIAVMDIGAAQDQFGRGGQLTRIDLRLAPGTDHAAFIRSLRASPDWPRGIQPAEPGDAAERVSNLSRAYRVNLTVLALVALFTGAFLVFSVLALGFGWCLPNRLCSDWSAAWLASRSAPRWPNSPCRCWAAIWAAAISKASRRPCGGVGGRRCSMVRSACWLHWLAAGGRRARRRRCLRRRR
jgi:putative ABC transport system permease protein